MIQVAATAFSDIDSENTLSCCAKRLTRPSTPSTTYSSTSAGAAISSASSMMRPNSALEDAHAGGGQPGSGVRTGHSAKL